MFLNGNEVIFGMTLVLILRYETKDVLCNSFNAILTDFNLAVGVEIPSHILRKDDEGHRSKKS